MSVQAQALPQASLREGISELQSCLDGLPQGMRHSGAFASYERRLAELYRNLVLLEASEFLKISDDATSSEESFREILEELATRADRLGRAARKQLLVQRVVRNSVWLLGFLAAWLLLPIGPEWFASGVVLESVSPRLGLSLALALGLAVIAEHYLGGRAFRAFLRAEEFSTLRESVEMAFGLSGEVMELGEYYTATARRIESLLDSIKKDGHLQHSGDVAKHRAP